MAAINTAAIVGRITHDLELNTTGSGKMVLSFALAVDGYNKDADASFIDCVAWGKAAEVLHQYAHKGKQIGVTGRLQTRIWERDGVKRKATELIVDQFQLLGDGKGGNDAAPASERYEQGGAAEKSSEKDVEDIDIDKPIDLSEIPF